MKESQSMPNPETTDQLERMISREIEKAYREGWDTGYTAGFTDGRSDGTYWCDREKDWQESNARASKDTSHGR